MIHKVKYLLSTIIIICSSYSIVAYAQVDLTNTPEQQFGKSIDSDLPADGSLNEYNQLENSELETENFRQEDVIAHGEKFFGKISTGIAAVIENAFSRYGNPNAYILGTETTIALIGGYRFGAGEFHQLGLPPQDLYWKGPSLGFDFGLDGNRVMMLVYNLPDSESIQKRFLGIDGSAYLIGGFGMSALSNGDIFVLRIRTGLGLRLGANLGYLKISNEQSLNPF